MSFEKKSYVKFTATAATAALVASAIVPTASAASFSDVSDKYKEAVNYLVENSITNGVTKTSFGTDDSIKRGDAAVMIAAALKLDVENAPASPFKDLNKRVAGAVNALYANEIIGGKTATTYAPDDKIKRSEMSKIIANAYQLNGEGVNNQFSDVSDRWDEYVNALVKHKITLGKNDKQFGSDDNVKRGEFALFMFRAKDLLPAGDVVSVKATTTLVDAKAEKQFLSFTINNGQETTVEKLVKAGYTVEFLATKENALKDAKTGELSKDLQAGDEFSYVVSISKDGKTIKSAEVKVKVENFAETVATLDEYTLTVGGVNLASNTLVLEEKATINGVKGTSLSGAELKFTDNSKLKFETSDKNVVLVSDAGEITTVAPGNATVTVTVTGSDKKMQIPVKVTNEDRAVKTVTTSAKSVNIITGKSQNVVLDVKDQYGDPFNAFTADNFAVVANDKTIANVVVSASEANEGKYTATVTATTETGSGTLEIKKGDVKYLTLPVNVGSSSEVANRKLELQNAEADLSIDLNPVKQDNVATFVYNEYNADGMLIGPVANFAGKYNVSASNDNIVVTEANGVITVKASKVGKADLILKEGSIERGRVSLNVVNTSPSIESVEFASSKVESTTAKMTDLLKAEGIKLTSTDAVSFDYVGGKGYIFVETTTADAPVYNVGADILLGTVDTKTANATAVTFDDEGALLIDGEALKVGQKGEFSLRVLSPSNNVLKVGTVTVDVK